MNDGLQLNITPRSDGPDAYNWVDMDMPEARVGKVRCRLDADRATIYNVTVFTEFQGQGYGRAVIDMLKARYPVIVADRVRHNAIWFWERMGFQAQPDGNWVYTRN